MSIEDWKEDASVRQTANSGCLSPRPSDRVDQGQSKGRWVSSSSARAFRKPSQPSQGHIGPLREYVASVLADWLELPVPRCELGINGGLPVALVSEVPNSITFSHLVSCGYCQPLRDKALLSLVRLAPIIVLDAWVSVGDRPRPLHSNHIYSVGADKWHSIDYADSLEGDFAQPYQLDFITAVRDSQTAVDACVVRASNVSSTDIKRLLDHPPTAFASSDLRRQIALFLDTRLRTLNKIIFNWLKTLST
jgi:hypothetical protein